MDGEQTSGVLIQVKEQQLWARGQEMDEKDREELRKKIQKKYEEEGSAYYSTTRLWDDGIIDPVDTRKVLAMSITASLNKKFKEKIFGVFRM